MDGNQHQAALGRRCRFGNCSIRAGQKSFDKCKYKLPFKEFFHVDLDDDKPNIHPEIVCDKHRALLERGLKALKKTTHLSLHNRPVSHFTITLKKTVQFALATIQSRQEGKESGKICLVQVGVTVTKIR